MKVYKFGGGTIKDSRSVRMLASIAREQDTDDMVIVVSAMNKITNSLEKLVESYFFGKRDPGDDFLVIADYHRSIAAELFPAKDHPGRQHVDMILEELKSYLDTSAVPDYDFEYDQIICYGELLSTAIVHHTLAGEGIENRLFDARRLIRTDNHYRNARVDWEETANLIARQLLPYFKKDGKLRKIALTQGFIGSSRTGHSTSLGREGSDFSAAIFAYHLSAKEVVVWKDVPGVLNADPRYFSDTVKLSSISYREALELSYYGAKVIHPKTIKPLQNKKIPLFVKDFYHPGEPGTIISQNAHSDGKIPSLIVKTKQVMVTLSPEDFSFIAVENLHYIFRIMEKFNIHLNLMQNSALSFSVCITDTPLLDDMISNLQVRFSVKINRDLHLITVRRYTEALIRKATAGREILLISRSRSTAQVVVKAG